MARLVRDLLIIVAVFVVGSLAFYAIRGTVNVAQQAPWLGVFMLFWTVRWLWQRRREPRARGPEPG